MVLDVSGIGAGRHELYSVSTIRGGHNLWFMLWCENFDVHRTSARRFGRPTLDGEEMSLAKEQNPLADYLAEFLCKRMDMVFTMHGDTDIEVDKKHPDYDKHVAAISSIILEGLLLQGKNENL